LGIKIFLQNFSNTNESDKLKNDTKISIQNKNTVRFLSSFLCFDSILTIRQNPAAVSTSIRSTFLLDRLGFFRELFRVDLAHEYIPDYKFNRDRSEFKLVQSSKIVCVVIYQGGKFSG
jgi:hypothetical protein